MPELVILLFLVLAGAAFCVATFLPAHLRTATRSLESLGTAAIGAALLGTILGPIQAGSWQPFGTNFESMLWLTLLTAIACLYVQLHRPISGLERVTGPVLVLLIVASIGLEIWLPREYDLRGVGVAVHRATSYAGAAAFCLAAISGILYLRLSRRLRAKAVPAAGAFGSLERLEHWTYLATLIGFALLTISLVTGLARLNLEDGSWAGWMPKLILAGGVWLVYGLILHTPILARLAPGLARVRGRKTAWLSIAGFALMIGAVAAVQWMPQSAPTAVIGGAP